VKGVSTCWERTGLTQKDKNLFQPPKKAPGSFRNSGTTADLGGIRCTRQKTKEGGLSSFAGVKGGELAAGLKTGQKN